jgi:diadenosine tetraphosphate (Ap4A) HIT family hydrolase
MKETMGTLLFLLVVGLCDCNPADPEKMAARQCGLCREAEKQSPDTTIFFLKDINPRKPNRWLALPRKHGNDHHSIADIPQDERTALWVAAIAKAKELFGDEWALAINGDQARTQCHTHIHVGKFIEGVEIDNFVVVSGPAEIPVPKDGTGLWVHPAGKKLHVHLGEQITETVLVR